MPDSFGDGADESTPLRVADQHSRVPLHVDAENGRVQQESLNECEVAPECQFDRRYGLSRRANEPFAGEVGEQ